MLTRFVRHEGFVGWKRVDRSLPRIVLTMTERANASLRRSDGWHADVVRIVFHRVVMADGDVVYCEEDHALTEDDFAGWSGEEAISKARQAVARAGRRFDGIDNFGEMILEAVLEELGAEFAGMVGGDAPGLDAAEPKKLGR
jgi:hypothetical protein